MDYIDIKWISWEEMKTLFANPLTATVAGIPSYATILPDGSVKFWPHPKAMQFDFAVKLRQGKK